jgi:Protein of unknown function (DUF3108)
VFALAPLAALAISAAPACGIPPLRDEPPPFRPGESLSYDVEVMGVVKAGSLTLAVEPPISRGSLLPLRARLRNTSVFAKVRRVKGYALSWVDAKTLRPQRYRDDAEEDGVRKTTDTRLDRAGPIAMAWTLGDKKGTTFFARQAEVLDLLSTVYYLRAARLDPGRPICVDLVANRRLWRLRGSVAPGSERVESAAGIFDTVRVDAVVTRADGGGKPRAVHFWFSKDERRLPVAAVGEIDLGPVSAKLSQANEARVQPAD